MIAYTFSKINISKKLFQPTFFLLFTSDYCVSMVKMVKMVKLHIDIFYIDC